MLPMAYRLLVDLVKTHYQERGLSQPSFTEKSHVILAKGRGGGFTRTYTPATHSTCWPTRLWRMHYALGSSLGRSTARSAGSNNITLKLTTIADIYKSTGQTLGGSARDATIYTGALINGGC